MFFQTQVLDFLFTLSQQQQEEQEEEQEEEPTPNFNLQKGPTGV